MEKKKKCPKCGTEMEKKQVGWWISDWICPKCRHREPVLK